MSLNIYGKSLASKITSVGVDKKRLYTIAAHEAGHIFFLHSVLRFSGTHGGIEGNGGYASCDQTRTNNTFIQALNSANDPKFAWNLLKMYQAGIAGEALLTGSYRLDCSERDRQNTFNFLQKYEKHMPHWFPCYGNYKNISSAWKDDKRLSKFGKEVLSANLDETFYLLKANIDKILQLANVINDAKFITPKQVAAILG